MKRDLQASAMLCTCIVLVLALFVFIFEKPQAVKANHYLAEIDTWCCSDMCEEMEIKLADMHYCEAWQDIVGVLRFNPNGHFGPGWYGAVHLDPTFEINHCSACEINFILVCDQSGQWVLWWSCGCGADPTYPPGYCNNGWYTLPDEHNSNTIPYEECGRLYAALFNPFGGGTCACGYMFAVAVEIDTRGHCD